MTRIIQDHGINADMTLDQLRDQLGAGRGEARLSQRVTYRTYENPASVYYTALLPNGDVLTARTTASVHQTASGLYYYDQPITTDLTDFTVLWDEGDPDRFRDEWVVVDT